MNPKSLLGRSQGQSHIPPWLPHLFALLFTLVPVFGQTSHVPYAPGSDGPGPTFTSENINHSYPGSYSSIRTVDFRNLDPLKNGHYKHDESHVYSSIDLDSIYYLSAPRRPREVPLSSCTRGSLQAAARAREGPPRYSPCRTATFGPYKRSAGIPTSKQVGPQIHSTQARTHS